MFLLDKKYWKIKKTKEKGLGVFAQKLIPTGTIIGDYVGKLIELKNMDFEEEKKNMYLMYYDDNRGIYPDLGKPGVHLINHSCSPNAWLMRHKDHTLVFALKDVLIGEEITISYLLPPKTNCDDCPHICLCNSISCSGSMHLTEDKYNRWQNFKNSENKNNYKPIRQKYLLPLNKYPKHISKNYIESVDRLIIYTD